MKKEKLFGTDGVRGIPGTYPLTHDLVADMAYLAAKLLIKRGKIHINGTAPCAVLARDTRGSGPALTRALVSGFSAAGVRTIDLGVAPTPAVAYLTPKLGALCGVVVSASHNPAQFNGVKFFTAQGGKMSSQLEDLIEAELPKSGLLFKKTAPRVEDGRRYVENYLEFLRSTFPATLDLSGMKIVLDCAHGAAAKLAPEIFSALGAKVVLLGCEPNGRNINDKRGALFPGEMQKLVLKHKADIGICFDGDADRCLVSDEKGSLIDGDGIICLSAMHLLKKGLLAGGKVVLTVMSNFGLIRFLETHGVSVVSVPVGDRHVSEALAKEHLTLGGENSGHIIYRQFAVTGDGMLTALQTLAALKSSGKPLSWHRKAYKATPQILKNLHTRKKTPISELPRTRALIGKYERALKGRGRMFVRYSGTEPLLRIMVEGPKLGELTRMAQEVAKAYIKETN
jgi:phosphoglucosamine mutase